MRILDRATRDGEPHGQLAGRTWCSKSSEPFEPTAPGPGGPFGPGRGTPDLPGMGMIPHPRQIGDGVGDGPPILVSADVTRTCDRAAPCGTCPKPDVASGMVLGLTEGQIKARPVLIQRVRNLDQVAPEQTQSLTGPWPEKTTIPAFPPSTTRAQCRNSAPTPLASTRGSQLAGSRLRPV